MENTVGSQIFNFLVMQGFDPETQNVDRESNNPAESDIYSFKFVGNSGKNYGTVVILLGDDKNLEVFCSDNLGKTMEPEDKDQWFSFLEQIKKLAVKNFLSFSISNINRLRYSMQSMAASLKESLFESWHGTKTTSYNDKPNSVRLMIKHKKLIGENDARFRYIESLFVETSQGERFKLPFTKLSGGRAMVEHIRNGGNPYDARGQHIASIVEELNILSRFKRANHGKVFEGNTEQLVNETENYYNNLNKVLKGLSSRRGYSSYFESWNPTEITEQDVIIENIRTLFVRNDIDSRIEQALPVLAKIQNNNKIKELEIFESWIDNLAEGTWSVPDTPAKKAELGKLLSDELIVGADATNATEQLYDLIGDDQLFDQLGELAKQTPDADARELVIKRLNELAPYNKDINEFVLELNKTEPTAQPEQPAQPEQTTQPAISEIKDPLITIKSLAFAR